MYGRNSLTELQLTLITFPNHHQTGSMLSVTGLSSYGVLVREQCLIMIAVLCLGLETRCVFTSHDQTWQSENEIINPVLPSKNDTTRMAPIYVKHPFVNCLQLV